MNTKKLKVANLLSVLVITIVVSALFFGLFELMHSFNLDLPLSKLRFFGDKYYYPLGIFPKAINISDQIMLLFIIISSLIFLSVDSFIDNEKDKDVKEKFRNAFSIGLICGLIFGTLLKLILTAAIGATVALVMFLTERNNRSFKRAIVHFFGIIIGSVAMSVIPGIFLTLAVWLSFKMKTGWSNYLKKKELK